jgi:tetratricopeptide (TPR) repeat protein
MLCKKLGSHRPKLRASTFTFFVCFCHFIYGEYAFNWDNQIEAIRVLASHENLLEAEEAGKVLLNGVEEGQAISLLELLGEICLRGKHYRKAADYYLQASKLVSEEKETLRLFIMAADAYYQNRDYDLAAAIYDERYRRDGDEEVLFRYGCALLHGENFEKLEQLTFNGERLRAHFDWNCATYWNHRGNFERSLHYLEPWIQRGIHEVKYYYFYAQMQYLRGRISEALRAIALGQIICHHSITAEAIPLWILQMRLDWKRGYFEGAQWIEQALRKQEGIDLKKILLWKLHGLQKLGYWKMALETSEELGVLDKGLAEFIGGEICFEKGNFLKSLEHFKSASNSGGGMRHAARYREGKIEAYLGNFRKAAAIYEQLSNDIATSDLKEKKHTQEFLENVLQRIHLAIDQSIF